MMMRFAALQRVVDPHDMLFGINPGQHPDRQQAGAQRLDRHQQVVGHDPDVGADLVDQLEQGQPVQRADRVVGDDHHLAGGQGDVLPFLIGDRIAEIEIIEHLFDELDALQVRVLCGKVDKDLLVQQPSGLRIGFTTEDTIFLSLRSG